MTVSIIIAVADYCENLKECVSRCLELEFRDYQILILPDSGLPKEGVFSLPQVKVIPTGKVTPPYKRDIGAIEAEGDILAFLDDDAYPSGEWLSKAIAVFKEKKDVSCVCGPAVTPESDSLSQKASGLVYGSFLVSGNHSFRYIPKKRREVFDFPSCNFLIKKEAFKKAGGFDRPYWPGEDTFLCLKVLKAGAKMIYDPEVLVFHHRRPLFKKHLIQIKNYALHRGYFARKYPENSRSVEYFIPSIFVLAVLAGGVASLYFSLLRSIYYFCLALYAFIITIVSLPAAYKEKLPLIGKIRLLIAVISGIILTHLTYGIYFFKGLFARKMPEES